GVHGAGGAAARRAPGGPGGAGGSHVHDYRAARLERRRPSERRPVAGETVMTESVDRTQLAILANAMHAIADEMGAILVRSAFSTIVREARDCATALLDADDNVVAQAEMIPIHNGGLSAAFRASAQQLDLSDIQPGEAVLLNDPYAGGQHLNDLILFQPIFV